MGNGSEIRSGQCQPSEIYRPVFSAGKVMIACFSASRPDIAHMDGFGIQQYFPPQAGLIVPAMQTVIKQPVNCAEHFSHFFLTALCCWLISLSEMSSRDNKYLSFRSEQTFVN